MKLNKQQFEETIRGKQTGLEFLENSNGLRAAITNYGARIVSLQPPDENGKPVDVVVGFNSIQDYLHSTETYYGAIVGRYANRVAKGTFSLQGKDYQLSINNPPNHLHGGPMGFHKQVWEFEEITKDKIKLHYFSKDGEENYPGNLHVWVSYHLTGNNGLAIHYKATTDQSTIINLTSHPFFNLNGQGSGSIEDHVLQVYADSYNPVDNSLVPTGIQPVKGSPFDFTEPQKIGKRINEQDEQLKFGHGYDHNMVLNGSGFRKAAKVTGDSSGIVMEVWTDQPGMQLYTGNHLKGENRIGNGETDRFRESFCLETQHFPDSPNQPEFPSTILHPGEEYSTVTEYRFT